MKPLRIGTRGSQLALWQANRVREAIEQSCGASSEIVIIKTSGDHFAGASFEDIGIRGVFTKELEEALFDGRADFAVHSMKDVPTDFSDLCRIVPIFSRDDPRDALVSRGGESLSNLPQGARIGTSSLRRASQLRQFRKDLRIVELRGNVDTRLRKLDAGECDALVLAKAGVDRLGISSRITEVISPAVILPAVGQGALCVEYFEPRSDEFRFFDRLVDRETMLSVRAERALLAELQGGCRLPLGAWARFVNGNMTLDACVLSADGAESMHRTGTEDCAASAEAERLGRRVAKQLLDAGADRLLRLAGRSA
ncbi:MAG: hydroxymethylbilane synthase [Candidatus Acidiferrales bacterium]